MTYPPEATNSNNPYRASMVAPKTSMAYQRRSFIPKIGPYVDAQSADISEQSLYTNSEQYGPERVPPYKPYRASVAPSRMSTVPQRRSYHPEVPSLTVPEMPWRDESPSTPEDVSEEGLTNLSRRGIPEYDDTLATTPKKDVWSMPEPPQYSSKRVLGKIKRLVKNRAKEIDILTVFTSEGDIVCSHEAPGAVQEKHRYIPSPNEGNYLRLALELGFKQEGCQFQFGTVTWLSGEQDEVDEKRTLLGSTANFSVQDPEAASHQFYGVLSPTGRYVFAAVLKETPSGAVSPGVTRKIRGLADKMEAYEAWAGRGGFMAKIAARL